MSKKEVLVKYILPEIADIILNYLTYIPWEIIDHYTAKSFGDRVTGYCCDKCDKDFMNYEYWYQSNNKILNLNFCLKCWDKYIPKYTYSDLMRKKEKNSTKCISCNRIVYGYDKWWSSEDWWNDYEEFIGWCRICQKCYPKSKNEFDIYIPSPDHVYIRSGITYDLSLQANRNIPYQLEGEEQMKIWAKYIKYYMHLSNDFGPIKQWVPFTELDEIPFFDMYTCLLVDCSDGTNGRIAIMNVEEYDKYADDYKEDEQIKTINVQVIFDNIHDYLMSYSKWKEEKVLADYQKLYQLVNADITKFKQCFDDELALLCNEFSSYVCIKSITYECFLGCGCRMIKYHKHIIIDKKNSKMGRNHQYYRHHPPRI